MTMINITLDGVAKQVEEGKTILEVAQEAGVFIPTLCHHPSLKPFASCFLCIVSVKGRKGLVPACATPVAPQMEIETQNEEISSSRKMALELLLSDHKGDCVAPCQSACPAETDVQGYIHLIRQKKFNEAISLIREKLALPFVCGTICPNPCEKECRRGEVDTPLSIRALKRLAAEKHYEDHKEKPVVYSKKDPSGHKVAIVGGGPAGLAAAFYLSKQGHEVHLFEREEMLGGMVRYGIPAFRLDWKLLDQEIDVLLSLGVKVHLGKALGRDFSLTSLKEEGYGATLLAIGAQSSKSLSIPREDAQGVYQGISFLKAVVEKKLSQKDLGQKVLVLGAGDVAMDCARVALRLGSDVQIVYRRTLKEMPASPHEREQAMEEGVFFNYLKAPQEVLVDGEGKVRGLLAQEMKIVEGRPVPVPEKFEEISATSIILAIGQSLEEDLLKGEGVSLTSKGTVAYNPKTFLTEKEGVFVAGDASLGPQTVVAALGEGRRAASMIDCFLREGKVPLKTPFDYQIKRTPEEIALIVSQTEKRARLSDHLHSLQQRLEGDGQKVISFSMSEEEAIEEASRCLKCGCSSRNDCKLRDYASLYEAHEEHFAGECRDYRVDESRADIAMDLNKCVSCALCVRLCEKQVFSLSSRGFKAHPDTFFGKSLKETSCDGCAVCIENCPTGALRHPDHEKEKVQNAHALKKNL